MAQNCMGKLALSYQYGQEVDDSTIKQLFIVHCKPTNTVRAIYTSSIFSSISRFFSYNCYLSTPILYLDNLFESK